MSRVLDPCRGGSFAETCGIRVVISDMITYDENGRVVEDDNAPKSATLRDHRFLRCS
jgi:hypothetical protein